MLAVGLIACGNGSNAQSPSSPKTPNNTNSGAVKGKVLVVYFSSTGNTKAIAATVADRLNAELYEIAPKVAYTADDLAYGNSSSRATREQNDATVRPDIASADIDMTEYDTIFIGYPIWWGQAPRIINTFLEKYDFSGKTIIPFCTSNSSGIGSSATKLSSSVSNTVSWQEGQRFAANTEKQALETWLQSLGAISTETVGEANMQDNNLFNLETKKVTLNSGYDMPIIGLGTYGLTDNTCVNAVSTALKNGYRLIDTAHIYSNEESVGRGIKQSGIPRKDIFVITKLYMHQYADAENAINEALKKLDTDYIDMMLLHH